MCERFFLYYCWSLLIRYSCYLNTLSLFFFFFKQTHSNTNLLLDKAAQQLLIGRAAGGHNKKSFECHELNILRQTMALYSFSHWSHAAAAFHILPLTSTSALITWSPAPERVGRGGRAVSWPEVFLVAHLHPGLTQHGHALGVLQPQGGLQKLEGLTGILLVDGLDLRLETEGAQGEIRREEREREREIVSTHTAVGQTDDCWGPTKHARSLCHKFCWSEDSYNLCAEEDQGQRLTP